LDLDLKVKLPGNEEKVTTSELPISLGRQRSNSEDHKAVEEEVNCDVRLIRAPKSFVK
jgi:hypothetical protein